jgi:phosphatidylglycerophosphatase A
MTGEGNRRPWSWWCATVCGIGLIPVAPGTAGSAVGLLAAWGVSVVAGSPGVIAVILILTPVGLAASAALAVRFKQSDPQVVVIDEVCGMMVTLAALPLTPLTASAGFLLFRGFDILKPFPIGWVERRWPGGWGIMADDLLAGLAANVCLRLLLVWWT